MPRSTSSKQAAPFRYNPPTIKMPNPPPVPYKPAAPPMQLPQLPQVPQQPTLMQSMKDGLGLGLGSSIAHNVVGRMFGAPAYTPKEEKKPCAAELREFENCMISNDTTFCGDKQSAYAECIKLNK